MGIIELAEHGCNKVHIILDTQLSLNDKGEDAQVSTEKNNFYFHGQGVVHGRDNRK